jgi:superfamily I DNA/RNA helicase
MWLPIKPDAFIRRLLSDPWMLGDAAEGILSAREQLHILRDFNDPWTIDDIPLIDESAELLGPWDPDAARASARESAERRHELQHAAQALDNTEMGGWIDAAGLVGRMSSSSERRSVAELAASDRTWVYGHIVVDEAQELSRMAWRVLARRATRKSMTIVGDVQQTSHPAGARNWEEALGGVKGNLDLHVLTVTYRITQQIADVATALLTAAGGDAPELHPVRDGAPVVEHSITPGELAALVTTTVADLAGRTAVIVPDDQIDELSSLLLSASAEFGIGDTALDAPIAILTARDTKGLEFDVVFVVDPQAMSLQTKRGADLYVAATRATQVMHLVRWKR